VKLKGEGVYNAVVIGAGTAGLVTAAVTASLGGRVALVERHRMGGDCLNTGCIPSKALISSARLIQQIRRAADWGLEPIEPRFDFARVFERMRERRAKIAPHDSQERFESLGVDVFRGHARFLSPSEVEVDGRLLTAKNFVVATGTRPAVPSVPGLSEVPFFTNETVFDELRERPDRLVVLGGGPVGCELGQVFARLGVRVTIIQRPREILDKEDADAAGLVRRVLEQEGVTVFAGAQARRVSRNGGALRVEVGIGDSERRTLDADAILVAAGRIANTDDLGLDAAGVAQGKNGITVNEQLQTSQPHIYAAGDVVGGGYRFTHVADAHARVVARNILFPWWKAKWDDSVVPWCTYTSPEVARVGLNESDARKRGAEFDVWKKPLEEVDRAVVESEEAGFAKVLTRKGGDRILGATIVSERAGDLVHELVLAMKVGVGLKEISSTIHAYPTFAEVSRQLADAYQKSRLTPGARRLFEWLYRRARRE
jgi:pyruvate/2-oxoglutarate dehydrogenase complex dihydrolipoamide dehydrogenase (E3) component